jgi:hypothetical protein
MFGMVCRTDVFDLGLKFSEFFRVTLWNEDGVVPKSAFAAFFEDHLSLDCAGEWALPLVPEGRSDRSQARSA